MEIYNQWLKSDILNENEKNELKNLSEKEIKDSFYKKISFGTSGIRGVMGIGTNKFNRFIVSQTTQAMADILGKSSVVIGFDSRNNSFEFAKLCAEILVSNGINVYIFDKLCPTPLVSFAILHYKAQAGINITASHNPKEYNGYKVYMQNGAQIDNEMAEKISKQIESVDILGKYNHISFDDGIKQGMIKLLGDETNELFINQSLKQLKNINCKDISVVYSPLFGAGRELCPKILRKIGVEQLYLTKNQMEVDGDFPDLPKGPNPEEMSSYEKSLDIANEKSADLVIVTDPDADRIGIMVRDKNGKYKHLTGNMTGCLLVDYIIKMGDLPEKPMVVKSIVTSQMVDFICKKNNIDCYSSFTGFRFISEIIDSKKDQNHIISLEESYGYLVGDFARDKDAITATALVVQMAMYYKNLGKTLIDALDDLYEIYGVNIEETTSLTLEGHDGSVKIAQIMSGLRENPINNISGIKVLQIRYFKDGYIYDFEKFTKMQMKGSDVVIFDLEDETQLIIRPSGTEPKVKVYILLKASNKTQANEKLLQLKQFIKTLFII